MTSKNNFRWLEDDIRDTLVLKVMHKNGNVDEFYGVFDVMDVLNTTGDELDIQTANIDDLTNLLTLGIVRFINIDDKNDILDIPFRKLYLLYKYSKRFEDNDDFRLISFEELDTFSVIDGTISNNFYVFSAKIKDVSEDLNNVMKIAYEYGDYGMQEKFDALCKITVINHQRIMASEKERILK